MLKRVYLLGLLAVFFYACNGGDTPTTETQDTEKPKIASVVSPGNNTKAVCGNEIAVNISVLQATSLKEISVYWNDSLIQSFSSPTAAISLGIPTKNSPVGKNDLKVVIQSTDGTTEEDNRSIILFSDVYADILVAKIIRTYPHQKTSYTQGLEFQNGQLFEGTGLTGQSVLAKVNLNSGEFIQKQDLPENIFGEGITVFNNEIYQLTWQARICYVYDLNTFEKKREFTYFGEGWGLSHNEKELIMSNGSSEIVFLNPTTFEKIRSVFVFDANREYVSINELEYHDGILYANVYQEDFILKIDPKTGKVLAKIDCSDVVKAGKELGDVLNGIAINEQNNKYYITGKNWPKLFEVKFVAP
jgi:glutamine cyclotransferase